MGMQTFWLERTDHVAVGLRRYTNGDGGFNCAHGHHHALVYTGTEPAEYDERDGHQVRTNGTTDVDHSDPRWPHSCAQLCGYEFTDDDHWQRWTELLYRRTDTQASSGSSTRVPRHPTLRRPSRAPAGMPGGCRSHVELMAST